MLFSIAFYGQEKDSVLINRETLKDILLSEAEYKNESNLLKNDTTNLRLIIKSKDVVIANNEEIIANNQEVIKGLENALKSVKLAYEDAVKKNRWKNFFRSIRDFFIGAGAMFLVLMFV